MYGLGWKKKKQLMDGLCVTFLLWLAAPVSQPEGVSPGRTVPVCHSFWHNSIQKHLGHYPPGKPPKTTVVYTQDLAPLMVPSFDMALKCPEQSSVKTTVFFHQGHFGSDVVPWPLYD